jgi:hypothetical protein
LLRQEWLFATFATDRGQLRAHGVCKLRFGPEHDRRPPAAAQAGGDGVPSIRQIRTRCERSVKAAGLIGLIPGQDRG